MPQRFLRPTIRQSKRWNRCPYLAQSLYIRLITLVDDFARYEADPELIRSEAFPYGDPEGNQITVENICEHLTTLAVKDMLLIYEVNGVKFLQLNRWTERARSGSKYPAPPKHLTTNVVPLSLKPSPSPSPLSYKACKGLTGKVGEMSIRFETCLDGQWVNDAGKWVNRIKTDASKCERVVSEVENAIKEKRIKTTPAQYAEQIWKEFK